MWPVQSWRRQGGPPAAGWVTCVQHWGALGDVTALTLGQLKFSGAWEEGGLGQRLSNLAAC